MTMMMKTGVGGVMIRGSSRKQSEGRSNEIRDTQPSAWCRNYKIPKTQTYKISKMSKPGFTKHHLLLHGLLGFIAQEILLWPKCQKWNIWLQKIKSFATYVYQIFEEKIIAAKKIRYFTTNIKSLVAKSKIFDCKY